MPQILQDVKITTADNKVFKFEHVAEKRINALSPGLPIFLELTSSLNFAVALIVLEPGMIVEYSNSQITSSQRMMGDVVGEATIVAPFADEDELGDDEG